MKNQDESGKSAERASFEQDLSPEELREEVLRLREELAAEHRKKEFLLSAIEALPNPVFVKDNQGRFVFFNKVYADFFGMKRREFLGKSVLELPFLSTEDRERYQEEDRKLIEHAEILHYETDFISAKGEICPSFYWSSGFEVPETGQKGLVGEIVDISKERELEKQLKTNIEQLKQANETIEAASRKDPLTGVFNRCFLEEQEKLFLASTVKKVVSICFLMLDLDHFKNVNDRFGHLGGDQVLIEFAKLLQESCRQNDLPIRYGGEEFLVFLYDVDLAQANDIAERIREKCSRELLLPDGNALTVSIGVAQYHPSETLNECVARADEALYEAKNTGRNKVVIKEWTEKS